MGVEYRSMEHSANVPSLAKYLEIFMNCQKRKVWIHLAGLVIAAPWLLGTGCPGASLIPVTAPDASKALNGTYLITSTTDDLSPLGTAPTLVIANGLLTQLGDTVLTPTSATATGSNYVWVSGATVSYLFTNYSITVTLNANLQPDNTLVGTLSATGQSSAYNVTLTKQ